MNVRTEPPPKSTDNVQTVPGSSSTCPAFLCVLIFALTALFQRSKDEVIVPTVLDGLKPLLQLRF